jgi:hypothetical protein
VEVAGPVQLRGRIDGRLPSLSGLLFLDDVDFQETHIHGPLNFSRCLFVKRLLLRNVDLRGELRLEDAEILGRGQVAGGTGVSIDLVGARLGGLIAPRLNAGGAWLDASGATLARGAVLSGARLRYLQCPGSTIGGTLALQADVRGGGQSGQVLRTEIETVDFSIAEIRGDVNVSGLLVREGLSLRNAKVSGDFRGAVQAPPREDNPLLRTDIGEADLSNVQIGGVLSLNGALVRSKLNLASSDLRGGALLAGGWIQRRGGFATEIRSLDLSSAKVGARLLLRGVAIGSANFENASIHGDLLVDCDVGWHLQRPPSNAACNEYRRQALTSRNDLWALAQLPKLSESPMSDNGFLRSTFGSIDARNLQMTGMLWLRGMDVRNDLSLIGCELRDFWVTPEDAFAPEVSGSFHLSAIRKATYTVLEALNCRGELRVIASELGPTLLRLGAVGSSVAPCSVGLLNIEDTKIAGPLVLTHLQVDGQISNAGKRGVWINNCEINGELSFWRETWLSSFHEANVGFEADRTLRPWDHGAGIIGPVRIRQCKIAGDCELTFMKALGPIGIDDCDIGGDLLMRSLVTLRRVSRQFADAPIQMTQNEPAFRTVAPSLTLRMTSVARDVDLTGLTLSAKGPCFWCEEEQVGRLDARYLTVKGDLSAYDCLREPQQTARHEAHFEIPGAFDLSSGEANHLLVSGHSFPGDGDSSDGADPVRNDGVILAGGHFRQVTFPYINRSKDGCPIPTDLTDVDVEVWRIGNTVEGEEPSAEVYKHLLESDPHFRRSTYRSIESNLRNHGHEDAANEIYRAMHVREHDESSRRKQPRGISWLFHMATWPVRMIGWHLIWRRLLRFGTDPTALAAVIFLLALLSFPVYLQSTNIEPTSAVLAMHADRAATETTPARWGTSDAIALLVRHHVPFLGVALRDEWQLRDSPGFRYGPFTIDLGSMSAEDWAGLMSILNMTMWPLLLAFLLRKLLRE